MDRLFAEIAGWGYSRTPGVPRRVPGIPAAVADPSRRGATDCSTWTAYAILATYRPTEPGRLYRDLQIFDPDRPWSPIEGIQRERIGVPTGIVAAPIGRWLLAQTWSGLEGGRVVAHSRGHSRLVRRHMGDRLQVLESSASARGSRDHVVMMSDVARWGAQTRFALLEAPPNE